MPDTEFRVDPDRLHAVAARLQQIRERLSDVHNPRVIGQECGSEDIASALDDFGKNWSKSYDNINEDIAEVAQIIGVAADGYKAVEHELAKTFEREGTTKHQPKRTRPK